MGNRGTAKIYDNLRDLIFLHVGDKFFNYFI